MAQKVSEKKIEAIFKALDHFPKGASIEEIGNALESPIPKRTLQRYLSFLINENRLEATGESRGRRYFLPKKDQLELPSAISKQENSTVSIEQLIPLSEEALSIQQKVRQPLQARRPVGYNASFLDKYRPNQTFYLSEGNRKRLFEIGKSDGERPAGTYARQIYNRLLIDLSWNSSRLEGNTFSLLETERLLELGEAPEGKDKMETQMILNHKAAIEFMVDYSEHLKFNSFTIFNLHALLSDNLLRDPRACGSLRSNPVSIAKSVYQPLAIPKVISQYFQQILDTTDAIKDPFEQSFFAMVHLPYLQPFLDVNKRVSRLAANIPLIRENLCPLSFVDVPEQTYITGLLSIYELNHVEVLREVYLWAYERSSSLYSATRQGLGEPDPFRLRYRNLIITLIAQIIRQPMDKQSAVEAIKQTALDVVPIADQKKFSEVVETELMSLHEGNIARFQIKPFEYEHWVKTWH